jgi:hypothetical protein
MCHLHSKLISFYNRVEKCLQRGTNWVLNKAVCASSVKGFITEMKSVYSAVRTGFLNKAVCASSVKGFITEMKSVYSAVGTGFLNKAVCASSVKG